MLVVPLRGCHRFCATERSTIAFVKVTQILLGFNDPPSSNQRMKRVCMRFSLCQAGWWGGTQCMGDKHRIMVWPISFSIALLGHYHRNGPVGLLGYMQEHARTSLSTLEIYEILCVFIKYGPVYAFAYHMSSLRKFGLILIRPQKLPFLLPLFVSPLQCIRVLAYRRTKVLG